MALSGTELYPWICSRQIVQVLAKKKHGQSLERKMRHIQLREDVWSKRVRSTKFVSGAQNESHGM